MLKHSPSLFFDILTEEDAEKRDEKIRRASLDIKTGKQHGGAAANGGSPAANGERAHGQQLHDAQQEQEQQEQEQQLVLSPQEVLQELLGDLFISPGRLEMGDLLGQGGFADVHAAQLADALMPSFREDAAVKRLRPDVLKSPDDLREFLTEANLLRKLQHRNIVRLRGVGANDLTDLVSMRESMFVVQEFVAGGDLKQMVMSAMTQPFDPPYTKTHAFTWALQIAEAMHYLHSVCRPMIIHRDLKLDNVLLTGGSMNERVAKLADFGLHKRVRKMTSSGALVTWNQELTYHGGEFERSFYGGRTYLSNSALSVASSMRGDDDSTHGSSMNGGSMHGGSMRGGGSLHGGGGSLHGGGGSLHGGGGSWHRGYAAAAALAASNGGAGLGRSGSNARPPLPPAPSGKMPRASSSSMLQAEAAAHAAPAPSVSLSDSAASLPTGSSTEAAGATDQQQEQQEQQRLLGVVRAKSSGRLGKQDFVAQVLSVPSSKSHVWQQGGLAGEGDKEVARTFAAVQALEGSVRAGSAFYQAAQEGQPKPQQQQQQQQQPQKQQQQQQPQQKQQKQLSQKQLLRQDSARGSQRFQLRRQQSELCPHLVQQLQAVAAGGQDSAKFIEATQKVGSVMYMAPEVLTGHQYNEAIDVFSFGIILYELLSGVVLASRVAMAGQHEELLDYARQVANGHREDIPAHWPAPVRQLVASCWAQDPRRRPSFKQVLRQLYELKQAGVDAQMEGLRPRGDYNPVMDCGCAIM